MLHKFAEFGKDFLTAFHTAPHLYIFSSIASFVLQGVWLLGLIIGIIMAVLGTYGLGVGGYAGFFTLATLILGFISAYYHLPLGNFIVRSVF